MKKMRLFIFILLTNVSFAGTDFTIRIPQEVVEAMDLPPELAARLSGGDIIGNGGGLLEQEFRFAYRRLGRLIETCSLSIQCHFSDSELILLKKIGSISRQFIDEKDRLIFLSEEEYPGFFRDLEDSQIRVAKTAFIPGAPIFINLDMIYVENLPVIDYPTMISILVHEIGHQAGERSHSLLDDMGAKLKDFVTRDTFVSSYRVGDSEAKVHIFNLEKNNHFAEIYFMYEGELVSLSSSVRDQVRCKREGSILVGFSLINPHWQRVRNQGELKVLGYRTWIKASCLELSTDAIWTEDSDLEVDFNFVSNHYVDYSLKVIN